MGWRLYRSAAGSWRAGPGHHAAWEVGTRALVELGFKPESGSRWRMRPTGRAHLSAREKGEERAGRRWAGWAKPCGAKKRKGQLGWAVREEGREGKGQDGLGRMEEKEKGREKMGRAKRRKRERGKKKCI
jgi:hypothetical protein